MVLWQVLDLKDSYRGLSGCFDRFPSNNMLLYLYNNSLSKQKKSWFEAGLIDCHYYMKGSDNNKFCTMLGLPQGSVLSPLLFNIFIKDIYALVERKKVKFADDGTIWQTGSDAKLLVEALERELVKIKDWTKNGE